MRKITPVFVLALAMMSNPVFAHHPAIDMVDSETYLMISDLVADTPHATLVFDEDMGSNGTTTIEVQSVSDAEEMIDNYLLAALSLLDEEITVSITFGEELETAASSYQSENDNNNRWLEGDDWGRGVVITVDTLLCGYGVPCEDILDE